MHRHISHLTQKNKSHHGSSKQSGKVDKNVMRPPTQSSFEMGKEQRYNKLVQARKLKREELLMKRRGLNFLTD